MFCLVERMTAPDDCILFVLGSGFWVGGMSCWAYVHYCDDEPKRSIYSQESHQSWIRAHDEWAWRSMKFVMKGMVVGMIATTSMAMYTGNL